MYLTRLTLSLRSASVRRDLADAYDMHRSLVRAFVANKEQSPPRFLWRLELESAWRDPIVLVQSQCKPDWSSYSSSGYLRKPPETKMIDPAELIHAGRHYRFRLFANPTVTQEGKRYGLSMENEQYAWLVRKSAKCGFSVETALVTVSDVIHLKGKDICLQQACFEGVLTATDVSALQNAVVKGVGPGKAFGLGMLSLSPR